MPDELVLLTGATGLVGFAVLQKLIEQNYRVRLAIRTPSKKQEIYDALDRAHLSSNLDFVIVPDMQVTSAFDQAVKGVRYVVHVASPLAVESDDLETSIIRPAVDVTLSMLHSALKEETLRKIVITSSIVAVMPSTPGSFDVDTVVPDPQGPWSNPFAAYIASKQFAYNATRKFIADFKPSFNVINVMPSFVIGPNGFATSRKHYLAGSNEVALAPLVGTVMPNNMTGCGCHVDDVATVHVAALESSVTGNRNFGVDVSVNGVEWNKGKDIIRLKAPEIANAFSMDGSVTSFSVGFDASRTQTQLGMKFKSFDEMIVDVARAYVAIGT